MIFKIVYNSVDGHYKDYKKMICLSLKILLTDEATFTNNGQVNLRNMHYSSIENPHWMREVDRQRPWSINVWPKFLILIK